MGRAVVTGEDEQGVLIQSGVFQGLIDLADDVVELHDKVSVIAVAAFAFEGFRWNPGAVGDGGGVVEKEGLVGVGSAWFLMSSTALWQKVGLASSSSKSGDLRPLMVVFLPRFSSFPKRFFPRVLPRPYDP